jgi:hypothetical protein
VSALVALKNTSESCKQNRAPRKLNLSMKIMTIEESFKAKSFAIFKSSVRFFYGFQRKIKY